MNKMKAYLLSSLILVALVSNGQVRMEKDYSNTFEVLPGNRIEISNKYGEVIVQSWEENSVRITALVIAEGRNEEAVNKNMNRTEVSMRKVGQLISVETKIERSGGLGTLLGDVEDYSKQLFGNQSLQVDLEVWLPMDIDLSIENKYGDIFLSSLNGEIDVTLAHGDIRGNRIEGHLDMEHSFGKANFDFVNRGRFTLRGSELVIDEGNSYSFQSSSSEIELYDTHYARLDSRNDKIKIVSINELHGFGRFTDLEAEGINRIVDLDFEFGEILMSNIEQRFTNIDLSSVSTDINLVLNQASYINATIEGDEQKMIVPNSMLSLSRDYNEEEKTVRLTGNLGPTQDFVSELTLIADGGDVIISIRDTPIFTER